MVGIVTGNGLGLERSSANVLGSRGQIGGAVHGRGGESVFVNAANGNLILNNRDEFLIGSGPDSAINRTYNSLGQFTDENGDNWANFNSRVVNHVGTVGQAGAYLDRLDWDGGATRYSWDVAVGAYVSKEGGGAHDRIGFDGQWWWQDGDSGIKEVYGAAYDNRVVSRTDRDGNAITYSYASASGNISRITTADGNYTDFIWSGNNLVRLTTSYTDIQTGTTKTLTRAHYSYDAQNRLIKVTVDLSPEDGAITDGRVFETSYSYHGSSKLVASITQTDGTRLDFSYDASNRITAFTEWVDASTSRTTTFSYGAGVTHVADPQGNITYLYYNGTGQLTAITEPAAVVGGSNRVTDFVYDNNGNLTYSQLAEASVISQSWYRYDANGNLFDVYTHLAGQGYQVTRHTYGNKNELLSSTTFTGFDPDGHGGTEPTGAMTTRYVYDSENHLRFKVSPEGRVTEYRYDAPGQLTSEIQYLGNILSSTSTPLSLAEAESWAAGADLSNTLRTDTSYDFRGNVSMQVSYSRVDSAGYGILDDGVTRTLYIYDQYGSLLSKRNASVTASASFLNLGDYNAGNLGSTPAVPINGKPANQYLVQAQGAWTALYNGMSSASEGEVVTSSFTLLGTGTNPSASLGLYGYASGWGANEAAIARIVSGPGQIVQEAGGLWNITGLSNTQATRVEVTRIYRQAEGLGAYLYVDRPSGWRTGQGLIVSDPTIERAITATETYAYDGMGRVIRHTDAKGVGTWTSYIDPQNRTVTTLANGLTQTSVYNRAGELVASSEARGGVADESFPTDIVNFGYSATRTSAGQLDGANAYQYTVGSAGTWTAAATGFTAKSGEIITFAISLKAVAGSEGPKLLGLWGTTTGEGAINTGTARVISGPGTITQRAGGYIIIDGLSTTEATRIEITRHYLQDETGGAYVYVDELGGYRAGQSLIMAAPTISRSRYDTSASSGSYTASDYNINNWTLGEVTAASAGTIGGSPAMQYTIAGPTNGRSQQAVAPNYINANAGDTITAAITLQGTGSTDTATFSIYGHTTHEGFGGINFSGTGRIVSGPGTLTQLYAGFWQISGLSASTPTRIEISRTFMKSEVASVRLYPDFANGSIVGRSIIAAAPAVSRTPGDMTSYKYDSLGRLKIKTDPVGTKIYYLYDRAGRKTAEVDGDGSLTEFRYDAADRLIATVEYENAVSVGSLAALDNPLANNEVSGIRPASSASDRWNWNIYDKAGRLIQSIDAAGFSTSYMYDGADRLVKTTRYYHSVSHYDASILAGFKANPPTAFVQAPWDASVDRTTVNYYDNDGNLIGTVDEEMFITEYVYDKTGRKVETVRYANATSVSYQPSGAFTNALPGTWAQVKASITASPASDIRNYWLYDGRGLLGATVDGEGNVTRYHHDARGNVIQEIRGRKLNIDAYIGAGAAQRTLALLPGWYLGGNLEEITNYQYDVRGQMVLRQKALASGHYENTAFTYDSMGNLLSEATSETVSSEYRTTTNRYDAKGRLIASVGGVGSNHMLALYGTSPTEAQKDFIFRTYGTRYVYDAADRLIQKLTPDGSGNSGDSNRTVYYYDGDGQLRYEVNALGEVTEHRYNVLEDRTDSITYGTRIAAGTVAILTGGLVTSTISYAVAAIANSAVDSRNQYAYDNSGRLWVHTHPGGGLNDYQSFYYNAFGEAQSTYSYPEAGQYVSQTHGYYRRGLKYWDWQGLNGSGTGSTQSTYAYDSFGRLIGRYTNNTDWRGIGYQYDRANRQARVIDRVGDFNEFYYDARSNVTHFQDGTGKITTYAYDQHNRTVTTTTAEGVVSTVKKNAYGQTIQITDGANRTTSYSYDKNGNLKTVTDAAGTTTKNYDNADRLVEVIDARGYKTTYSYDAVGRTLTETRDPGGLNITTAYAYDAKGQQIQITHALGTAQQRIDLMVYDLKGQKVQVVQDAGGMAIATNYQYRADGKVIRMIEAAGYAAERRTDYEYDSMGRLTREIVDPAGLALSTRTYYDVNNNVVAITDARGFTTRFVYDRENRQIFSVSAGGEVVETGYDAAGRVKWTRGYANRIATATVDGWTNEVAEATVRASFVASTADTIVRIAYDGDGRKVYELDGEGYLTGFVYDGAGNLTKLIRYAEQASGPLVLNAADLVTSGFNRITPQTSAAVTSFAYDSANRLTSTTDAEGYSEYYYYDAVGNRTQVTNKLGGVTGYTYDALGRLTYEWVDAAVYDNSGGLLASGFYKNIYEYDALGNITRHVQGHVVLPGGGVAPGRLDTYFTYDKLGRLVSKTLSQVQQYDPPTGGDNPVTPVESYQYDQRGNLILVTDAAGAKTFSYYDGDNRKTAEISPVGQYKSWTYDGQGNVLTERRWGTLVSLPASAGGNPPATPGGEYRETGYYYDRSGWLSYSFVNNVRVGIYSGSSYSNSIQTVSTLHYTDAFGNVIRTVDGNGNSTYHWYDRNGREVQKLDAEGYVTTWARDEDGNVTTERRYATRFTGSPGAVSVAASSADRVTNFTYDKNGRRLTETRVGVGSFTVSSAGALLGSANDSTIQYSYNGLGEVTRKTEANGDVIDYAYDSQGRLTWQRDPGIIDQNGVAAYHRTWFFYDGLGNLVRSTEQAVDANHNYASGYGSGDDRITRYQYGPGGRLRSMTDAAGYTRVYQYDIRGNLQREYIEHSRSSGEYLSNSISYIYDIAGRRTSTIQHDYLGYTGWQYMPWQDVSYNAYSEIASKSIGGVVQEQFFYDNAGRVTKTNSGDGVWKFFVHDANGNVTLTLTAQGAYETGGYNQADALAVLFGWNYAVTSFALTSINQSVFNVTVTAYDKRNMATVSYEPGRQVAGSTQTLTRSQSYNAFGEVASETDARGYTTNYTYNTMGRVTRKEAPSVGVTAENGAVTTLRPTENFAYDISGRLIATQDANGWWTRRLLLAGTGHGGEEALVLKEFRPDSSIWETRYDAYRDARVTLDGLGRATSQSFDKMGRITQVTRPAGQAGSLVETFAYDGLGRRIKAWNNLYGASEAATTDYDALGRVTSTRAQGGDITTTVYSWRTDIATTGLGSFGGWRATSTYANGLTSETDSDTFGREVRKRDMSGWRTTTVSFDKAGRVTSRNTAGTVQNYSYFNTGQVASASGPQGSESYSYDANGNRISEYMTNSGGAVIKNATAQYDALGRMTHWTETGSTTTPAASTITAYDAVGNIRRTQASWRGLDGYGNAAATASSRDHWYRYDAANRLVVDKGVLSGGVITRGYADGRDIQYNAAGERVAVLSTNAKAGRWRTIEYPNGDTEEVWISGTFSESRESYGYDGAGRLVSVHSSQGSTVLDNDGDGLPDGSIPAAPTGGVLRSSFGYDLLGRMTSQSDYGGLDSLPVTTITYSRAIAYNAKGQALTDDATTLRARYGATGYDSWRTLTRNDYDADGNLNTQAGSGYALGSVVWAHGQTWKGISTDAIDDHMTRYYYDWRDGAVQSSIAYDKHYGYSNNNGPSGQFTLSNFNANFTTYYYYDGVGNLTSATVNDGVPKSIAYTNDINGQVIRRDETRISSPGQMAPHELFYRFAGKQTGMVGNDGTNEVAYDQSVRERSAASPEITSTNAGLFRNGTNSGTAGYADFAQSIEGFNSYQQASATGSYTARAGDTLASVAASLWGDANLWYRLAEANGLSGSSALIEGQRLILPAGVTKNSHNASTFQPYDPSEVMGNTQPTTPKPPKKAKCGAFGQLLLTAIAIAVAVLIAGPGAPLLAQVGAAMAGSVVSQGVGVATGIQEKFSFKQVALAGLSAGIGGGVGSALGKGAMAGSQVLGDVVRGAATSALSQGVAVAMGLQDKFSFTAVATAGIGAGVAGAVMRSLSKGSYAREATTRSELNAKGVLQEVSYSKGSWMANGDPGFGAQAAATMADTIAQAATRSILKGNSFGDNLMANLPSALGNLAGRALAGGLRSAFDGKSSKPPETAQQSANSGTDGQTMGQQTTDDVIAENEIVVTARRAVAYQGLNIQTRPSSLQELLSSPFTPFSDKMRLQAMVDETAHTLHDAHRQNVQALSDAAEKQRLANLAAGSDGPEIVVTASKAAIARAKAKAIMTQTVGNMKGVETSFGARWSDTFAREPNNIDRVAYFRTNYLNNGPEALADRIWNEGDYSDISRGALDQLAILAASDQGFAKVHANLSARVSDLRSRADRMVWDVVRSGLAVVDTPTAAIRMFGKSEYNWENGLTLAGSIGAPILKVGGKFIDEGLGVTLDLSKIKHPYIDQATRNALEPNIFADGHLHHIWPLNGTAAQRVRVREIQQWMGSLGVDAIKGAENLVYAPNRGHTNAAFEAMYREFYALRQLGATRDDVISALNSLKNEAIKR